MTESLTTLRASLQTLEQQLRTRARQNQQMSGTLADANVSYFDCRAKSFTECADELAAVLAAPEQLQRQERNVAATWTKPLVDTSIDPNAGVVVGVPAVEQFRSRAALPEAPDLRQGCGCQCCDHGEGSDCACDCHAIGRCSAAEELDASDLTDIRWAVNVAFPNSPATRERLMSKLIALDPPPAPPETTP